LTLEPGKGAFRVWDPVGKKAYSVNGKELWTAKDLAEGIQVELPSQERVLLVLTESN